jgi:uncharacterized protein (UPF0147 family)
MAEEQIQEVILSIEDLQEDGTLPKGIKSKLDAIIEILKQDEDASIKVNKTLHELEKIDSDNNTDSYVRTQLLNIASMLENC